jgi:hypothetical protein
MNISSYIYINICIGWHIQLYIFRKKHIDKTDILNVYINKIEHD